MRTRRKPLPITNDALERHGRPMSTLELIGVLQGRYAENDIRMGLWGLIDKHRVYLRRDRRLELEPAHRRA